MRSSASAHPLAGMFLAFCALLTACGSGPAEPSTGDLRVVVSTSGADPDADGYLVSLDGENPQRIPAAAEATMSDLAPGAHQLRVSEIASNCTLQGDNPRVVQVEAGRVAEAAIAVTCIAQQGSLRVEATSAGWDVDADGYQVLIDGNVAGTVGSSGTVTLADISAGSHSVTLAGVAPNCALTTPRLREVTVGFAEETAVAFQASCALASGETAEQILLGDGRIIRVRSDGSGATYLTSDQVYADDPAWSPDRDKIAYEQNPLPLDVFESWIWGIPSPGATPVQITDTRSDGDPSWSPDGSRLVIRNLGTTPGLVVVNADGSDRRPITDGPYHEAPAWSPDGSRIVFTNHGDPFGKLYLVQPDGSGLTPISTPGIFGLFATSWSPDGTRLAFTGAEDGTTIGLWIMNDDGSGQVRITASDVTVYMASWSPTGDRLAFTGVRGAERGLFTIRPDGSELTFRYATLETSVSWAR